jgi:hypothetical protein
LEGLLGTKKWLKMPAEARYRLLHDEWEDGIKSSFDGRDRIWKIAIPFECLDQASLQLGGPLPKITLTANDVRGAFDPVVSKIRAMIDEQITAVRMKKDKNPKVRV